MSTATPQDDCLALTLVGEVKSVPFESETTVTFNANVKAPTLSNEEFEKRKNVNIVAIIDTSGSMGGEPLRLVRETLDFIVTQLKDGDHLSLVSFGDEARLLLPLTNMSEAGKTSATKCVSDLHADGMTNLSGGIELGFDQLCDLYGISRCSGRDKSVTPTATTSTALPASVTSVLVLTDGQANRGISATESLVAHVGKLFGPIAVAASKANGSATLHSFGFSQGHNPELMTRMAEAGNGVFYYVPNGDRIGDVFADCLGGLLSVLAINVELEIEVQASGATISEIHTPFAIAALEPQKRVKVTLGQLYSEQSCDILIDVKLPATSAADLDVKVLQLTLTSLNRREQLATAQAIATVDRVAAADPVITTQEPNKVVVDQKARYATASALKEAIAHKSAGRTDEARAVLNKAKQSVASYGGYVQQLDTASNELSNANQGYLWGQMRGNYAQSSTAQSVNDNDEDNAVSYSNNIKKQMVAKKRAQASSVVPGPAQLPPGRYAPSAYGAPPQQQQQQQQQSPYSQQQYLA